MNEFDRAISDYKQVLRLEPQNEDSWSFWMSTLLEAGRLNEAIEGKISPQDCEK